MGLQNPSKNRLFQAATTNVLDKLWKMKLICCCSSEIALLLIILTYPTKQLER